MLRPKYQQKLTLAFILLVSALILSAEPTFADKANKKSRKSSSNSQSKQQTSKQASASRSRQSSNAAASRSRSTAASSSRTTQSRVRQRSTTSSNRNNVTRTTSRSSRPATSRSTNTTRKVTSSNTRKSSSTRTNTNRITNRNKISIPRSSTSTNRVTTTRSSITIRQPAVSSNNRIRSSTSPRLSNPIGTQPQSTSNIQSQPSKSSTNRISTRIDNIFGPQRTVSSNLTSQPAANYNNRISSRKSQQIGNVIGRQSTSPSRIRKRSTRKSTNRNASIINSVKSPTRTPPSNSARQPAVSPNNRVSSIDRAERIGNVNSSPKRMPPSNEANQSAAGLKNRINSSKSRGIFNPINAKQSSRRSKRSNDNTGRRRDSRITDKIANNRTSRSITDRNTWNRKPKAGADAGDRTNSGRADRKAHRDTYTTVNDTTTRTDKRASDHRPRSHHFHTKRHSRLIYRDRPYRRYDYHKYQHTYIDYHNRIRYQRIWPKYRFIVCYDNGLNWAFRYVYPYYHRKYVFVSLGGYWPGDYRYARYYWYGCHPYYWYGYYPIAREVQSDTYNYYTYNYYYDNDGRLYQQDQIGNAGYYDNIAQQPAEDPAQATLADSYFEEAVEAFEENNYDIAAEKFATAMEFAPDDMVLPFAYCQALLAAERYSQAAEVLRTALTKISPDKEGVFYPRGLYSDEDILLGQLDELAEKVEIFNFDADLQLLLGYQLLGIGQLDEAVTPLINAGRDLKNADAAAVLLELLEKIKTYEEKTETEEAEPEETEIYGVETETNEVEPEGTRIKAIEISQSSANKNPVQSNIIDDKKTKRVKETVLLATLCVLAGSTGIGHFFRF